MYNHSNWLQHINPLVVFPITAQVFKQELQSLPGHKLVHVEFMTCSSKHFNTDSRKCLVRKLSIYVIFYTTEQLRVGGLAQGLIIYSLPVMRSELTACSILMAYLSSVPIFPQTCYLSLILITSCTSVRTCIPDSSLRLGLFFSVLFHHIQLRYCVHTSSGCCSRILQ